MKTRFIDFSERGVEAAVGMFGPDGHVGGRFVVRIDWSMRQKLGLSYPMKRCFRPLCDGH